MLHAWTQSLLVSITSRRLDVACNFTLTLYFSLKRPFHFDLAINILVFIKVRKLLMWKTRKIKLTCICKQPDYTDDTNDDRGASASGEVNQRREVN